MNIHLMNVAVDLIEQRLTPVANIITKNQHIFPCTFNRENKNSKGTYANVI